MEGIPSAAAVIAYKLTDASSWWNDGNESPLWQDRIFHILAALYHVVAAVALIQLVRIQLRCRSTVGRAEGFPLSQLCGEWGSGFSFRIPQRCAEVAARGEVFNPIFQFLSWHNTMESLELDSLFMEYSHAL